MGRDRGGSARAGRGPDRVGQDPRGVPVVARPAAHRAGAREGRSGAGCSTSPRSRRWASTSSATCGRRWPASATPPTRLRVDKLPELSVGVRSGDTTAQERRTLSSRPPDILITTPESLFLMLTSQAREILRGVETVIVDEVHAVAGSKRGAHLSVSLERLDALLDTPAQRVGLSATVRPLDEVARFLGGHAPVDIVSPPAEKALGPQGRRPRRGHDRPRRRCPYDVDRDAADADDGRSGSIWPHVEEHVADLIEQHRSTIVFANSRRLAERLTARLNEIATTRAGGDLPGRRQATGADHGPVRCERSAGAEVVIAKAHHGSVSKEQRALIEDDLKRGRLPCVVATSSLELGIDMGAVDLVVQIESPPSVASALQRVGRAGHQVGEVSHGVLFPKHRGDLAQTAVAVERMRSGAHRVDAGAGQPARRAGPAGRRHHRARGVDRRRPLRPPTPQRAVRQPAPQRLRGDPRPAQRPLPQRRVRRAPAPQSSGTASAAPSPAGPAPSGSPSPAAAPSPTAGCSGSSWSARAPAAGSASSTRRWSTSPASATSSRWERPAGGSRTSPTTGCSSPPPLASRAGCRSGRATPSAAPPSSARPSGASPASWPPCLGHRRPRGRPRRASTRTPPTTWSPTSTSRSRRPASCPATARCWSSGSETSSATGGWSSTPPTAPPSTRRGRWRSTPGSASATASTARRWPPTTAS